jgi:hypothetical protein
VDAASADLRFFFFLWRGRTCVGRFSSSAFDPAHPISSSGTNTAEHPPELSSGSRGLTI